MFYVREEKGLERIVKSVGNLLQINDDASLIVQYIKERTSGSCLLNGNWKMLSIARS